MDAEQRCWYTSTYIISGLSLCSPLKWQPPPQSPGTTIEGPHTMCFRPFHVFISAIMAPIQINTLLSFRLTHEEDLLIRKSFQFIETMNECITLQQQDK